MSAESHGIAENLVRAGIRVGLVITLGAGALGFNATKAEAFQDDLHTNGECPDPTSSNGTLVIETGMEGSITATNQDSQTLSITARVTGDTLNGQSLAEGTPVSKADTPAGIYVVKNLPPGIFNVYFKDITGGEYNHSEGINCGAAIKPPTTGSAPTTIPGTPSTTQLPVGEAPRPTDQGGYRLAARDGGIFSFDKAFFGSATDGSGSVVAAAETPAGDGYYTVNSGGQLRHFGDTKDNNPGMPGNLMPIGESVVDMSVTPTDRGKWELTSIGKVIPLGDAEFFGDASDMHLNKPIVGMTTTPDGKGYWLVASDGGVFAYGDAAYHGGTGDVKLQKPIVKMAGTPDGKGYWLVASDGGVFAFGSAKFYGSTGNIRLNKPVVDIVPSPTGKGYILVASDGGTFAFGDATYHGSLGNTQLNSPIVGAMKKKTRY